MYARTTIVGHLGKDPEMQYLPDGTGKTKFSVAVNRRIKKDGEWTDATDWYNVEVWGKKAESSNQYLHKGSKVLVSGEPQSWEYEGSIYWKLKAFDVVFMDKKQDNEPDF